MRSPKKYPDAYLHNENFMDDDLPTPRVSLDPATAETSGRGTLVILILLILLLLALAFGSGMSDAHDVLEGFEGDPNHGHPNGWQQRGGHHVAPCSPTSTPCSTCSAVTFARQAEPHTQRPRHRP